MDVISPNTSPPASVLSPNAPMFVPAAFRAVEDFSDEWWALVHSSPWFQDYWLRERFQDPQTTPVFSTNDDHALDNLDSLLDTKKEEKKDHVKDLVTLASLKWRNIRVLAETPKFAEKAPKIMNKKVIPRPIQQPR